VQHGAVGVGALPDAVQRVLVQMFPWQVPEQHSSPAAQATPDGEQYVSEVHLPAEQISEQHSPPLTQVSPTALPHDGGGGARHVPLVHVVPSQQSLCVLHVPPPVWHDGVLVHAPAWQVSPLQHSPSPEHPALSALQVVGTSHFPSVPQTSPLEQSGVEEHAHPAAFGVAAHGSADVAHFPALQMPEQQSAATEHAASIAAHVGSVPDSGFVHARASDAAATSSRRRSDVRMLASLQTLRPTMAQHARIFY
jgi:hypothetical protein